MIQHEGKKYLRPVWGWDFEGNRKLIGFIDVYDAINAFGVTCPATAHAIKKLLCAGIRGKGDTAADLKGVDAALQRATQLEEEARHTPIILAAARKELAQRSARKPKVKRNVPKPAKRSG